MWFWKNGEKEGVQPETGLVAYVHSYSMVNLAVFSHNGEQRAETSVYLLPDGNERLANRYATWMPYQKGQAAKLEALEKTVKEGQT